jgi:DNA-binding MarR family transcriptional regulator
MGQLDVDALNERSKSGLLATMALSGANSVSAGELKKLMDRTQRALKFQREQGDLLTPQALQIMFNIALEPGITMQNLQKPTGLNLSSVSRNLSALGKYHRLGKEGLDFCETVQDPIERRRMIAFLTKKGRDFLSNYLTILTGEPVCIESPTSHEWLARRHRLASR